MPDAQVAITHDNNWCAIWKRLHALLAGQKVHVEDTNGLKSNLGIVQSVPASVSTAASNGETFLGEVGRANDNLVTESEIIHQDIVVQPVSDSSKVSSLNTMDHKECNEALVQVSLPISYHQ